MAWLVIAFAVGVMLGGFLMVRRQMRAMNQPLARPRRGPRADDSYIATTSTPLMSAGGGGQHHGRSADPDGPATGVHHGHAGTHHHGGHHHGDHASGDSGSGGGDSGGSFGGG